MTLEALDNDRRKESEASSKCKQVWLNMVELGMYIYIYILVWSSLFILVRIRVLRTCVSNESRQARLQWMLLGRSGRSGPGNRWFLQGWVTPVTT